MRRTRDPTGSGRRVETAKSARDTVTAHLDALRDMGEGGLALTDHVTLTMMETGEVIRGCSAVTSMLVFLHRLALAAPPGVVHLVAASYQVMIEAEFSGQHIGEFAGIGPTGRTVSVHFAAAYDLGGDAITAIRLYLPLDALVRQLRQP